MTLIGSILIGLVLLVGFANGLRRGGIKEGTALIGVLLGALLVEYWSKPWGQTLSDRSGLRINNAVLLLSLVLLIGTALFSGYGSGLFFKRRAMKTGERIGGGLLGLLNMGLLISFTLRYTQLLYFNETDPTQPVQSWIRAGIISRFMFYWLGYVLLGAALALGVVSLITATLRLGRLAATPRPAPAARPGGSKPQAAPGGAKPQGAGAAGPSQNGSGGGQGQAGARPADGGAAAPAQPSIPAGKQEAFIDRQPPRGGA
jgi:uncharacterized membrane protein required for colicin V production